ncbi:lysophospholipid acyltransferase family protein [Desulfobacula toluolica]|uniref:PlsC2: predicted 1-acyl-sn-glycerol-3-phosphate acyltransferase n=1 Tax=Desulfobacula toluolica (strain DSM 7467 / Tol2) TaxID=651182 RepID=K0NGR8_DESTT|nr:lysophospholipid acyltransferase family protein [Desulfobacula toluolica]CCK80145.1 PlsC2: predicted 1-acyl-sn-glycerol-3-phosphate acyltransferase [Desulfobacula toluolica Tol2]
MKKIISTGLWIVGGIFFLVSAFILVLCLFTLSRETTFTMARRLFKILIRVMGIRLIVTGKEYIIPDQPYLIMGNHQSLFDIFVIPAAIPLCFVGVEASYHFSLPVWGYLIRKWGCIPIKRNNLENAILSLETAKKALLSGISIGILPEGHRTLTGEMKPFKKGPFHLAKDAHTDILPFGIKGLFDYNRKGSLILNPGVVMVNIGKPISHEEFQNLSIEELQQTLFETIYKLSKS